MNNCEELRCPQLQLGLRYLREALQCIVHTIIFARSISSASTVRQPIEECCEQLDIWYLKNVDPKISAEVESKILSFTSGFQAMLERGITRQAQFSISFYELYEKPGFISFIPVEEKVYFEVWHVPVLVNDMFSPLCEPLRFKTFPTLSPTPTKSLSQAAACLTLQSRPVSAFLSDISTKKEVDSPPLPAHTLEEFPPFTSPMSYASPSPASQADFRIDRALSPTSFASHMQRPFSNNEWNTYPSTLSSTYVGSKGNLSQENHGELLFMEKPSSSPTLSSAHRPEIRTHKSISPTVTVSPSSSHSHSFHRSLMEDILIQTRVSSDVRERIQFILEKIRDKQNHLPFPPSDCGMYRFEITFEGPGGKKTSRFYPHSFMNSSMRNFSYLS
ncbi:hypothetical protein IE077_002136 [Cardiosporidium cionae]|uniref:Autophagy-related protein 101 n=1 Tax=Cardiosporidium cionae TaxID=476202 RepID=A0ABQ7J4Q9_9APIC|nr:hypothetical protein IE077_002136 [Cardiosporidium cionae]|eukprot:KAF8818151.1 hypothetical protein IE077_002136 [Cardiosporidium cionae]